MDPPVDPHPSPGSSHPGDEAAPAGPPQATGELGARVGLAPGQRYRCAACGNLTRFDVVVSERSRRFWHPDLGGTGRIEEEDVRTTVESVTCRWCGGGDVVVEAAPVGGERGDRRG